MNSMRENRELIKMCRGKREVWAGAAVMMLNSIFAIWTPLV
jgi:hypothetical protein